MGLLANREDLQRANQVILPKKETVVEALYDKHNSNSAPFTDIQTFGEISYIYGPVEWGGIAMFGFLVTINDVKIQNTLLIW